MKNPIILILFMIISQIVNAQVEIEISKNYTVLLLFPSNVSESILGGDNLKFYVDLPSKEGSQHNKKIVKLSYSPVSNDTIGVTNYTVVTQNGKGYEFILKLVDTPKKFSHSIKEGNYNFSLNETQSSQTKENTLTTINSKKHYFTKDEKTQYKEANKPILFKENKKDISNIAEDIISKKPAIVDFFDKNSKIILNLKGVYYHNDNIYISLSLKNKSSINYDIRFINYSITDTYKKSSSGQKSVYSPILIHREPRTIKSKDENVFVVVFKKFTLNKKRALKIDITEEKGNRELSLLLPNNLINNPFKF